jgi:hypothetical protein
MTGSGKCGNELGFHIINGISYLVEGLIASQEELCSL